MSEELQQLKNIVEAALFAAERPLSLDDILSLFEETARPEKKKMREALEALCADYAERSVELKELSSGFQFEVKKDFSPWIKKLWEERPSRYSRAFLETLALIAYKQPITRGEISDVRGVTVTPHIIRALMDRQWIQIAGYREVPGKPALFGTTKQFLNDFGLKSLTELPPLPDLKEITQLSEALRSQLPLEAPAETENVASEGVAAEEIEAENLGAENIASDEVTSENIVSPCQGPIFSPVFK